ncbi:IS200/IS605 family transposase [Paenibacillus azoreducens]|uniref:IS200/IS605 family transposase n=1 Tax=Paenibacillus azoreducens TaxID=116718 RepID=A0A919YKH5_9BACL|nr:IS200/IS605 family transposase [Paenibacillus azoreducens]GIO51020.1 IS200/IS605 family transposase [Paenibacillus azoreducens]
MCYTEVMEEYRRTKTTVSLLNYHFVFCPRYRRKIFRNQAVDERFKELVRQICKEHDFKIVAMETDQDHCYLFLNVPPTYSPADIMAKVKGGTSRILRDEFDFLSALPSLWTRSYFVSTAGDVSSQTIKRYVENQRTR